LKKETVIISLLYLYSDGTILYFMRYF